MQDTSALELVDSFEARFDVAAMRFTTHDMPPWAYIRFLLAQVVADRIEGTSYYLEPVPSDERLGNPGYVARTLAELPRSLVPRSSKVLIFGSGATNARTPEGYHNRLVDHFARAAGAEVFEDSYAQRYASPRRLPGLRYHDPLRAIAAIGGKVRRLPRRDAGIISELLRLASSHFGRFLLPADIALLRRLLEQAARRMPFWRALYHRVFERVRPALCLIEDASYGHYTHVLAWAHAAGITTAEYQHGRTYPQHPAYQLSHGLHDPQWAQYLPQHYLAWGSYWLRYLRTPVKPHIIGFPDLAERGRVLKEQTGSRDQLLFVSSGLDVGLYQRVLAELDTAAGKRYRLIFRPHPGERAGAREKYGEILDRYGWRLDPESDPYASFSKSVLVVGDLSTALFEALEFDCPVVLIDAPLPRNLMPPDVFPFCKRFDDLEALLAASRQTRVSRHELWADNWQERFRRFLTECHITPPQTAGPGGIDRA
jgi:hypothetical protein